MSFSCVVLFQESSVSFSIFPTFLPSSKLNSNFYFYTTFSRPQMLLSSLHFYYNGSFVFCYSSCSFRLKALCVLILIHNKQKSLKLYVSDPLLGACRFVQALLCPFLAYPASGPLWTLPYFTLLFCMAIWEACPARKENPKQVNGSRKMGIYYLCIKEVSLFELDSC